jgi:hypothetical protein
MVSVLNLDNFFCSASIEMMTNPASLEAKSSVVRAGAPRHGQPMLRGEQARVGYAARARKKDAEATRLNAATDGEANSGLEKRLSRLSATFYTAYGVGGIYQR